MDLNRSSAFPDNINLVPPSQESALENQSAVSSSRIGNDGNGRKIEDVTPIHVTAPSPSLRSALKSSSNSSSQKNEVRRIGFKENNAIRTFVRDVPIQESILSDLTIPMKKVQTELLVKQKFEESRNRLSLFMSGIREAWANFTYYPKFTKVLALDESKNTIFFSKIESLRSIRNQYQLNGKLDFKRLQARVEQCVKRGDFEEVKSMIKSFGMEDKKIRMEKDTQALGFIFYALKRLKEDTSATLDSPITRLLASEEFQKS